MSKLLLLMICIRFWFSNESGRAREKLVFAFYRWKLSLVYLACAAGAAGYHGIISSSTFSQQFGSDCALKLSGFLHPQLPVKKCHPLLTSLLCTEKQMWRNQKRWEKIVLRERSREMGEKRAVVIMSGQVMKKEKIAERVAVSRREITI